MKAFVMEAGQYKLKDMPEPTAQPGEVVVKIRDAGVNRRDLGLLKRYGDNPEALIIGSDGAGVVESLGEGVTAFEVGDEVIINPGLRWVQNSDAPPEGFDILGMPDHGTFAEKIAISAEQLEKKPAHLSWEQAGGLALPALTGYRALFTKGQLKKGDTLFIPGAGSGVATFLIQFAKNAGATVIVTSRSEDKLARAKEIGADIAIPTDSDWVKELEGHTIDLVIDSVGGATFNRSLEVLKKGGRIVIFGATTADNVDFNLRSFFYGQYQLFGSTMGSREELRDMIQHIEQHDTHPAVDRVFSLDEAQEAFDYLAQGKQFGKVVLRASE
ncbi:zinc-binding dehydrogenase [Planococcus sp. CP5-4]|uniref:zinc-binding dehydrogenase n=1 Tax=unclassified Planococcus (in: firmicutes) TaxID=2662419 RepID=UPI001C2467D1|nr:MULTISPECIES: zinc-binding dehydrogenase [unclassified Planococcus (in: firmicutes)]MBU9672459.1 zinc-binding dehydrogenase [Planococcus sp. CP5-4_YE]MBV0909509.1 zinc-binding dehydrogenase [Planococcus sp. CP5-4_UN]MBW6064239.1 zinc-binding dehydrogenase [Planococcus sp. CP5-4]